MPESQSRNFNTTQNSKFQIDSPKTTEELLSSSVLVQPCFFSDELCTNAKCLIFPQPIKAKNFDAACEWASSSEAPMFIVEEDLPRFEVEGFGAYRFQIIKEASEVGFGFAHLKFFRARSQRHLGVRGVIQDWVENIGYKGPSHFHVSVRAGSESTMYLASPFLHEFEWSLLLAEQSRAFRGSHQFERSLWDALALRLEEKASFPKSAVQSPSTT